MQQVPNDQCYFCPHIIKSTDLRCATCGGFVCTACKKCTCHKISSQSESAGDIHDKRNS